MATFVNNLGLVLKDLGDLPGRVRPTSGRCASTKAPSGRSTRRWPVMSTTWGACCGDLGELPGARAAFERALQHL